MEVDAAPSDERQAELFKKLYAYRDNLNKYVTFAMTIQTMYKRDLGALVNLFEFYVHMERLDMALDICENDIFKSFNLLESPLFDAHLSIFAKQIIANLSIKSLSNTTSSNSASSSSSSSSKAEEFYFKLFAKFSAANQDRLVRLLLEKYQAKLMFIKLFCETSAGDNKNKQQQQQQQQQQHSLDIKNFYANLASCKDELFELRDLLLIHRKLIPEYGLFLIDGLLNTEKQLFANLLQRQQQQQQQQLPQQHQLIDPAILSIEWRSLNVMRRLCVVDLIPEFVYLISKLDNRHCYRWIEKSLEFFCKYVLNAIEIRHHHRQLPTTNDAIRSTMDISYTSVKLLHVRALQPFLFYCSLCAAFLCYLLLCQNSELRSSIDEATSADESSREIRLKLKGLDEFCVPAPTGAAAAAAAGSGVATTPFVNVYKLLDEIGKKLEWPTLVSTATATTTTTPAMFAALCIEDKLIHLFQLKAANVARGEKAASMSSLNKQISFYGISYFFNKLVEFHAISKSLFPNTSPSAAAGSASLLVMSPAIDDNDDDDDHNACSSGTAAIAETTTNSSVESLIVCLASCLRIWHKLNTNKEYLTIVTKCLSNSKLDSLACYKSFLADYFNNYVLTTSSDSARHINYSSLVDLSLKQKLPVLACLLRNETKSFDVRLVFFPLSSYLHAFVEILTTQTHKINTAILRRARAGSRPAGGREALSIQAIATAAVASSTALVHPTRNIEQQIRPVRVQSLQLTQVLRQAHRGQDTTGDDRTLLFHRLFTVYM